MTCAHLARLRASSHGDLVGLNRRRRRADIQPYLARATGRWRECPTGISAREKIAAPTTAVQEVASAEPGVRSLVVRRAAPLEYERAQRLRAMAAVRQDLEGLAARSKPGQLKAAAQLGAAAQHILGRHHAHRYYDWAYHQDGFRCCEHPVNLKRAQAREGT